MVEKSDSSDMLRFLKVVSGANIVPDVINEDEIIDEEDTTVKPPTGSRCSGSDYTYMKNILDKFKAATEMTTQTLMEDSKVDPRIRESLSTKVLPNNQGMIVGSWEIRTSLLETYNTEKKYYTLAQAFEDKTRCVWLCEKCGNILFEFLKKYWKNKEVK